MYADIRSKDPNNDISTGKTSTVDSNSVSISIKRESPRHLHYPNWFVRLSATTTWEVSSGMRGGDFKEMESQLRIDITPEELKDLVDVLVAEGLLEFVVSCKVNSVE